MKLKARTVISCRSSDEEDGKHYYHFPRKLSLRYWNVFNNNKLGWWQPPQKRHTTKNF